MTGRHGIPPLTWYAEALTGSLPAAPPRPDPEQVGTAFAAYTAHRLGVDDETRALAAYIDAESARLEALFDTVLPPDTTARYERPAP